MIADAVRPRLLRLLAFLGVPLAVAGAVVVLAATPAQAGALTYHGTFRFSSGTSCLEVRGAGRTDRTPIIAGLCEANPNERWAIFRDVDRGVYWILAYGGEWPLNKCMDGPDSNPAILHIYGCHGGHQQRWQLSVTAFASTQIRQSGTDECVGILVDPFTGVRNGAQINCASAPLWTLIPA
jgi:hypothetical protein